jgi:hypothetical protein
MPPREKVKITTEDGNLVEAIAPVIISASRSTDIPACYSDWFIKRLEIGYLVWINPFNRKQTIYITFDNTRVIVFWTKNAEPLLKHLKTLDKLKLNYYIQFTLNDYVQENLEPGIPSLSDRIETFKQISDIIGKEKVIWRYDPILVSNQLSLPMILSRIKNIGDQIHKYTNRLIFSFIDINQYDKVINNVASSGIRELTQNEIYDFSSQLSVINQSWGLLIGTCGEEIDLSHMGISAMSCIDGSLISNLFGSDSKLMQYLSHHNKKDKGQRKSCLCIESKDIGQYNTCTNLCIYCYANRTKGEVNKNYSQHLKNRLAETITGESITPSNDDQKKQANFSQFN